MPKRISFSTLKPSIFCSLIFDLGGRLAFQSRDAVHAATSTSSVGRSENVEVNAIASGKRKSVYRDNRINLLGQTGTSVLVIFRISESRRVFASPIRNYTESPTRRSRKLEISVVPFDRSILYFRAACLATAVSQYKHLVCI